MRLCIFPDQEIINPFFRMMRYSQIPQRMIDPQQKSQKLELKSTLRREQSQKHYVKDIWLKNVLSEK